jgi:hypothetical protein
MPESVIDPSTANAVETKTCRNCGAGLTGLFCAICGQKVVDLNPTLNHFLHEVWHELTHVDGKLIPSVRMLLTSPGALTLEHYAGRRARYISPMRLYLVFSILYFAIAAITPSSNFKVTVSAKQQSGWSVETDRQSDTEELRKLGYESQKELQQAVSDAIVRWLPRMMFLLVPLFAALIALSVRHLKWNYPRHVHFALHLHTTWFMLLTVSSLARLIPYQLIGQVVATIVGVWIFVYFMLALRRAYSLPYAGALWRTMAVGLSYGVLLILSLFIIVMPLVIAGEK